MDREIVHDFCSLLPHRDQCDVFSLLLDYSRSIDRLAFLFNRAQEYKLVLALSQKQSHRSLDSIRRRFAISVSFGAAFGIIAAFLLVFLFSSEEICCSL